MSDYKVAKSEEQWRTELSAEDYAICRQKGTERAFTGCYWDEKRAGQYLCKGCGELLFDAETKYDSGSGWPSFFAPVNGEMIEELVDNSHGMRRVEICCANCGSHLGHVFPDGPRPTGMRYCVNSASLDFSSKE